MKGIMNKIEEIMDRVWFKTETLMDFNISVTLRHMNKIQ